MSALHDSAAPSSPGDLLSALSAKDMSELKMELDAFVVQHAVHHRPIALVSSGGTVADLEHNSVRCLDNFSTGLRGAISVEEFLRRGYAVIHLTRTGSASPFARVLSNYLGLKQANYSLDVDSLGKLFAVKGENVDDELVNTVLAEEERDPWLTKTSPSWSNRRNDLRQIPSSTAEVNGTKGLDDGGDVALHRGLLHSSRVHKALQERSTAIRENRLLTIEFRSVEDYLAKLQLSAQCLADCQSLVIFYLAAAVSDFYIPRSERAEHKIQSHGSDGLTLNLRPVPKTLGLLREYWAPNAFVVTFKLETDKQILRTKAERAVQRCGCHLVIGNLLQTRHEKVWVLSPAYQREVKPLSAKDWSLVEIAKPSSAPAVAYDKDSLESSILDFVVQSHFEFISWHFNCASNGLGLKAAKSSITVLKEKKEAVKNQLFWKQVKCVGMEIAGAAMAVLLSYITNAALQRRLQSR